jgi:hypothetical protein
MLNYSIGKRLKMKKNHCGSFSLWLAQRCSASRPDLARERPITISRATVTDRRSPLVSPLFPQIPLLCSPAWQRRLNCQRRAGHPSPPLCRKDAHVCTCRPKPSHRLRCTVASHHRCPPASAPRHAATGEIPTTPRAKVLHASLCELPSHPFACRLACEPLASCIATEASRRPIALVDRCQGRCTATMPAPSTR